MQTTSHPTTHNAALRRPREAHQSANGAGRLFWMEASRIDPVTRQSWKREPLAAFTKTDKRDMVRQQTYNYLSRGLWVEVFDLDTKELIAGPFDPDQPMPKFIL